MSNVLSGSEAGPKSGKTRALIVFVHGYGASGRDLISLAQFFAPAFPDSHFLSPDAPAACEMGGGGFQWFSLRDWSPASMLRGAQEAAPALNLFIDFHLKRFDLTEDKLALVGFSQGTMMALYAALRRSKPFAGVVGFSGALVGEQGITSKPPVCLIHGTEDNVVPFGAMGLAEATLKREGVSVEAHARQGLMHSIDPEGLDIAISFLKGKLG